MIKLLYKALPKYIQEENSTTKLRHILRNFLITSGVYSVLEE